MSKVKIHEFDLGIYPRKIWIAITTENKFDGFYELSKMDDNCDAIVEPAYDSDNNKGGIFIRFLSKKSMTTGIIAHESFHAAMRVFEYIGAKLDFDNQEPLCYLAEYIANCCEQVKNNKFKEEKENGSNRTIKKAAQAEED